jgi:CPA1 family monovalent cation:H+ antiporter
MIVVLPILVFEGALVANLDHLRASSTPILALAIPGVALALFGTAGVATWVLALPFAVALLLGAILAITDTVSVLLAFRAVRVPARLGAVMEGESLFNDGTALVLVATCASIAIRGQVEPTEIAGSLAVAIVGGVMFGAVFGALGAAVLRAAPDHLTAVLVTIVVVFATSMLSERVHASPVIAVVVVGLILGQTARMSLPSSRVLALNGFWETMGFGLNVLVFLLVGMRIDTSSLVAEAPAVLLAVGAMHIGRALAVYGSFLALRLLGQERMPIAWQHVMVLGNIKGALSMAAVLALPAAVPYRSRLIVIVFGVTFISLVTQALPFPRVLRWLRVMLQSGRAELEDARARLVTARSGQAELDSLLAAGQISRRAHAERMAQLQREAIAADAVLRQAEMEGDDLHVEAAVLHAQRGALMAAAHRGIISSDAAHTHLAELDEKILRARDRAEAHE